MCVPHLTVPVVIFITLGEQERNCGISKLVKSKTVMGDSVTIVSRSKFYPAGCMHRAGLSG